MANITINTKNGTIELAKGFAKAASRYGTTEYAQLQEVRRDYPKYAIKIVEHKKFTKSEKSETKEIDIYKGLTFTYMENYISKHDDGGEIMRDYKTLKGTSEDAMEMLAESVGYNKIREWFLNTYPEIRDFHKKRAELLKKKNNEKTSA